jgi:hypothetical protein
VKRFGFGQNSNTTVPLFLGRVPVMLVTQSIKHSGVYLFLHGFGFLQTEDIRGGGLKPFSKTFIEGGTNAVYVIGKDLQTLFFTKI